MSIRSLSLGSLGAGLLTLGLMAGAQSAPPAPAQQPQQSAAPQQPFTLTVKTQLVVLDTVVTDKKGNIVHNLTRDDFQIFENDEPQRIKNFEAPMSNVLPSNQAINSTAELDAIAPQTPVSIIVLDEMNTRFEDEAFARYSLKKYLNTKGDTLDQPTMLVAIDLQNFTVLRDYTTSKKAILDALDHHLARYPWHLGSTGRAGSWAGEIFNQAFNALIQVAEATNGHPGHKNMIWVGRGFPSVNMEDMDQDDADTLKKAIETCTNMLRDSRITLYTVDPAGISTTQSQDAEGIAIDDPFGGDVNFSTMAEATGGHAFFGRNDVDNLIGTSVRNGVEFYTLTYSPTTMSDDPGEFRKIRIVMKNPNYKAVARAGYYPDAPPPASHEADGKISSRVIYDISTAAQNMLVYDGVPLTITRDTTNKDEFVIHVSEKALDWKDNGDQPRTAEIAIVVASFDRKGKLLEKSAKNVTAQAPPTPAGQVPPARALNIHAHIKTAEPAARLRFIVRVASSGKVGADNYLLVDAKELKTPTSYIPRDERKAQRRGGPQP